MFYLIDCNDKDIADIDALYYENKPTYDPINASNVSLALSDPDIAKIVDKANDVQSNLNEVKDQISLVKISISFLLFILSSLPFLQILDSRSS